MIEALIAAALAGAVTTLVRARRSDKGIDSRSRRGRDEVYDGSTPSIDVGAVNSTAQGYVEDKKSSRVMVHKGIEHRIRSIADIRLKKYLNDGRISEEEYRELTSYGYVSSSSNNSSNSNADVNGGDAYAHTGYGIDHMHDESRSSSKSRKKIESDSMMMQEILMRLDRLNSRLDSLEGKVDANKIGSSYITHPSTLPTMLAQVQDQDQVHAYYNHDSRKRSFRVQSRGRGRGRGRERVVRKRMANDDSEGVRMVEAIESKGDEGREDKKAYDYEGLEVMVIDANSNPDSITKTSMMEKEMSGISYESWHEMGHDDGRRDDNNNTTTTTTTNNNSSNSIDNTMIAGSSNYDSSNDELESIKKQIMDVLARLEKEDV
ncbi:hypothetical protein HRbin04_01176 [archaeon HR04]|uniref:Uncharacterized protein HGP-09 n=1 Tax=uncultured Candidatus Nitrosocaldus sp. TaxID=766501 RepID=Q1ERB7_9ARCH|nr:hypothetical protein [uncultured Candidatus Nitrosocaldus sp.]GBC73770.1 hypothetical protein HRbin04_01176 [archaeon HR04]